MCTNFYWQDVQPEESRQRVFNSAHAEARHFFLNVLVLHFGQSTSLFPKTSFFKLFPAFITFIFVYRHYLFTIHFSLLTSYFFLGTFPSPSKISQGDICKRMFGQLHYYWIGNCCDVRAHHGSIQDMERISDARNDYFRLKKKLS